MKKSSVKEIRERFESDVERFSNLETGQESTVDAKICLQVISEAAATIQPQAKRLLDVGCGAGNFTLKLLAKLEGLDCTLMDLSGAMLQRARQRVSAYNPSGVTTMEADIREVDFSGAPFDIIVSGAALHHLRGEEEWELVFHKLYQALAPGGCLLISDLVCEESPELQRYMEKRYRSYLESMGGAPYAQKVLGYIEQEDSPRPLWYQLELMKRVGFRYADVLHKNICFAVYCAIK